MRSNETGDRTEQEAFWTSGLQATTDVAYSGANYARRRGAKQAVKPNTTPARLDQRTTETPIYEPNSSPRLSKKP